MMRLSRILPIAILLASCASKPAVEIGRQRMIVTEETAFLSESFHAAPAIRAGDFIYLSGVPISFANAKEASAEEIAESVRGAYDVVLRTLAAAGASKENIIDVTTFHADMRLSQEAVALVHKELFGQEPYPAWTAIGADKLWLDEILLEIKVIAYLPE